METIMELDDDYSEYIDKNEDENFILVKTLVDHYLHSFGEKYNLYYEVNQRNHLIIKSYNIIRKKYLCSPNSRWDVDKTAMTATIIKSYLMSEVANSN